MTQQPKEQPDKTLVALNEGNMFFHIGHNKAKKCVTIDFTEPLVHLELNEAQAMMLANSLARQASQMLVFAASEEKHMLKGHADAK